MDWWQWSIAAGVLAFTGWGHRVLNARARSGHQQTSLLRWMRENDHREGNPRGWVAQEPFPKPGDGEVARRAGHGVEVLLKVYAGCIDGDGGTDNQRIEDALGE